jgi:predicted nucleotidyltransferase
LSSQAISRRLVARQEELQAQGAQSPALFRSAARGEADQSSDLGVVVEFSRPIGLFGLSDLKHMIELTIGVDKVDLMTREGIHTAVKSVIL